MQALSKDATACLKRSRKQAKEGFRRENIYDARQLSPCCQSHKDKVVG